MHSDSVLGSAHMNLTPIALGLFCSSQAQQFDQTTCAMTCMWPEGPLTVNNNKSFGHNVLSKQTNAPLRLIFLVSPSIMPLAVIAETGHLISALGYMRFSSICKFQNAKKIPRCGTWQKFLGADKSLQANHTKSLLFSDKLPDSGN